MVSASGIKSGEGALVAQYGPVFLRLEFGRDKVSKKADSIRIEPQQIKEFSITLDINSFLPSFRLKISDSSGFLTHMIPFDRNLSRLHVQLAKSTATELDDTVDFDFDVYRRFPRSDFIYDIEGLLIVDSLFSPEKIRGFDGTIQSTLETIGTELGAGSSEISVSLNYVKNLVKPGWSDAKFLNYLKHNLSGNSKEVCFYTFVKCVATDTVFVFKSVKDFVSQIPKYNFTLCIAPFEDKDSGAVYYPILEYRVVDNYKLIGITGARRQEYMYFDYTAGTPKITSVDIDGNSDPLLDYSSFTQFHQIDKMDDAQDNISMFDTGRTNDFHSDFKGRALGAFHRNVTELSKIWIDTIGIEDVYPGDIVMIQFLEHEMPSEKFGYQYQGYWMIERVVHLIGNGFITKLLLTRNGTDAAVSDHNLLQAANWKKK